MRVLENTLMRMFGRPRGTLGKLGGMIMARTNAAFARCMISLLEVQPTDKVLEVGFGPGVAIQLLANLAPAGRVAGVDCSREMLEQARVRNAEAIERGVVDLRLGSAEKLPFEDGAFDAVLAINSMQVWPDIMAGLREMRRVIRSGDRVALGFTPYSGRPRAGVPELLSAAGFAQVRVVDTEHGFCVLALKAVRITNPVIPPLYLPAATMTTAAAPRPAEHRFRHPSRTPASICG